MFDANANLALMFVQILMLSFTSGLLVLSRSVLLSLLPSNPRFERKKVITGVMDLKGEI